MFLSLWNTAYVRGWHCLSWGDSNTSKNQCINFLISYWQCNNNSNYFCPGTKYPSSDCSFQDCCNYLLASCPCRAGTNAIQPRLYSASNVDFHSGPLRKKKYIVSFLNNKIHHYTSLSTNTHTVMGWFNSPHSKVPYTMFDFMVCVPARFNFQEIS